MLTERFSGHYVSKLSRPNLTQHLIKQRKTGAGEAIRTPDPNLGNVLINACPSDLVLSGFRLNRRGCALS
jgi:hypothetical protein